MKKMMFTAAAATMFAAPAAAWEGQKVACYDKHWVPATYTTSKHLEYPPRTSGNMSTARW